MKIRKNDKVIVMRGKDKGKTGLVLQTNPQKNTLLVEGINQAKKHKKGEAKGRGELITITRPIDASKVMLLDPETNKSTRVGFIMEGNVKSRISKKTKNKLVTVKNIVTESKSDENESKKGSKGKKQNKTSDKKSEKKKSTKSE